MSRAKRKQPQYTLSDGTKVYGFELCTFHLNHSTKLHHAYVVRGNGTPWFGILIAVPEGKGRYRFVRAAALEDGRSQGHDALHEAIEHVVTETSKDGLRADARAFKRLAHSTIGHLFEYVDEHTPI